MYKNIVKLLEERHISGSMLGGILGIDPKAALNKMRGITDFKLTEFKKIAKMFPEYDTKYLMKWDGEETMED